MKKLMSPLWAIAGLRDGKNYKLSENLLVWSPLLAIGIAFPWVIKSEFAITQLSYLFIYSVIVLGLNILIGTAGLHSLGHAAFVSIGAYFTAFFYGGTFKGITLPMVPSLFLGGLIASLVGVALGFPAVKVRGPYLSLITLGLMLSVPALLKSNYLEPYTGGSLGIFITAPEAPQFLNFISAPTWRLYINMVVFVLMLSISYILLYRTKIGRGLRAIRDGEERSSVMGVNITLYKVTAFGLSAFYAGIGGGLFALNTGFVGSESFTLRDSLEYLVATVVGGFGSILGSVVGGAFLAFQTQITDLLAKLLPNGEQLLWAVFGIIVIISTILVPRGVAGELKYRLAQLARPKT